MKVNGPENLNIHRTPGENAPKPQPAKSSDPQAPQPGGEVSSSDAAYQQYIQKVPVTEEIDLQAVAHAKALLQPGQLDTSEAADRAAETILTSGI